MIANYRINSCVSMIKLYNFSLEYPVPAQEFTLCDRTIQTFVLVRTGIPPAQQGVAPSFSSIVHSRACQTETMNMSKQTCDNWPTAKLSKVELSTTHFHVQQAAGWQPGIYQLPRRQPSLKHCISCSIVFKVLFDRTRKPNMYNFRFIVTLHQQNQIHVSPFAELQNNETSRLL